MGKTVRKWFWVWNEDKEKDFLEEMALKGLRLVRVGFGKYIFEEDEPKKMIYQFDFKGIGKMKEGEYLQIYEDAGWQFMSRFGSWYYFAREWNEEELDLSLFSNNESKRAKIKRILLFLLITGVPLYYQTIIMFPIMSGEKFEYPSFYFFFRIIIAVITVFHVLAVVKIINMYRKLKNPIME